MNPLQLCKKLYANYKSQSWWPANSGFEVCVGAILTQNTAWNNVEKAVANLKKAKMLSCEKLADSKLEKIARLIKPSGYYNQKAKSLKLFCQYVQKNYKGSLQRLFSLPVLALRKELLSLHGIGNETADSIILYAAGKPMFVIDAYTKRLNERLPLNPKAETYARLQAFFQSALPKSPRLYNEFHALVVRHCKEACRKKPLCNALNFPMLLQRY